uniref:Uncharacterized protein n=1 Tax=Anguilla anguilla TaxID=7936 RepID=A0A0E9X7N5_ANGAN
MYNHEVRTKCTATPASSFNRLNDLLPFHRSKAQSPMFATRRSFAYLYGSFYCDFLTILKPEENSESWYLRR